jgi:hypothetical protein
MLFPKVLLFRLALVAAICTVGITLDDRRDLLAAEAGQQFIDRMNMLDRMIKDVIGEPRADNVAQCRSIPFGAKACGGPATYLAYSTVRTNEGQLRALIDEFNQNARNYNQVSGRMSDCMYVPEPNIELVGGVCKLR